MKKYLLAILLAFSLSSFALPPGYNTLTITTVSGSNPAFQYTDANGNAQAKNFVTNQPITISLLPDGNRIVFRVGATNQVVLDVTTDYIVIDGVNYSTPSVQVTGSAMQIRLIQLFPKAIGGSGGTATNRNADSLGGQPSYYYAPISQQNTNTAAISNEVTNRTNAVALKVNIADTAAMLANTTKQGNTFNSANQLVKLNGSGQLPAIDGSLLTNLPSGGTATTNASQLTSGTLPDARLSTNVTQQGNTFNGTNQLVKTDGTGKLPIGVLSDFTFPEFTEGPTGTFNLTVGGVAANKLAGSYATTAQNALKVNISDTAAMLANDRTAINTNTAAIALKISIASFIIGETPTGTVNSSNTAFTLAFTPIANKEIVYLNGIRQKRGTDYTISSATITFTTAPTTGDELLSDYLK